MTDALLKWADQEWSEGNQKKAYELVEMAIKLDPYFGGVAKYYTALYIHHAGEFRKNKVGGIDLYAVLGFTAANHPSITHDSIKERYSKFAKLVHPNEFPSPMADGALKLMDMAWAILGNEYSREDYDVCVGLRCPKPRHIDKPVEASMTKSNTADQRPKVIYVKRCTPEGV